MLSTAVAVKSSRGPQCRAEQSMLRFRYCSLGSESSTGVRKVTVSDSTAASMESWSGQSGGAVGPVILCRG